MKLELSFIKKLTIRIVPRWNRVADNTYLRVLPLRSKAKNIPVIHVIGDSHAFLFKRRFPFKVHHVGAATAYNLIKHDSSTKAREKVFSILSDLGKAEKVILVFGEIDCRIHIYNQYVKNNRLSSLSELIQNSIDNYGNFLDDLRGFDINFCVLSIPPASKQDNIYGYPFYPPEEVRRTISRDYNQALKAFCSERDFPYIDIYSCVVDDCGHIQKRYSKKDQVHLNRRALTVVERELRLNRFL